MSAQHWTTSAGGTSPGPLCSLSFLGCLGLWMGFVFPGIYTLADLGLGIMQGFAASGVRPAPVFHKSRHKGWIHPSAWPTAKMHVFLAPNPRP